MSHTTPSIYPTSNTLGGHNSYQTGTTNLSGTYIPTNPVPGSTYNPTSQYNSLTRHTNLIGTTMNSLGGVGMSSNLGQTSVLGRQ